MRTENESPPAPLTHPFPASRSEPGSVRPARLRNLVWMLAVLLAGFSKPLYELAVFAWHNDLYSFIVLMPVVTIYLIWQKRKGLSADGTSARSIAAGFFFAGFVLLAGYWLAIHSGWKLTVDDRLAFTTAACFALLCGIFCFSISREALSEVALPLGMLAFMIPMPSVLLSWIEIFLQYASAWVAHGMFTLAFTNFARSGLVFDLPGMRLRVAPECSGIHSTWILLITSLLAGHLFLRSPRNRAILALAVLPLALLRNGFRIFTIGELCVHIGPEMIDSPIHHKGGPLFFALSLIPFFILLTWLHRSERRGQGLSKKAKI